MASSATPEQYSCFFESTVWDRNPSVNNTLTRDTLEKHTVTVEECAESLDAQSENAQTIDMVLGDKSRTVDDKAQTVDVETISIAESETDTLVDSEDDAWSVVSDGDSIVVHENQRLLSDDDQADHQCEVDEADDEREADGVDEDGDVDDEEHPDDRGMEEDLHGVTDSEEHHLDNSGEDEDLNGCTDDEQSLDDTLMDSDKEEQLDDCTEESIRICEIKEVLQACRTEAWEYECDLEQRHNKELDDLNREHEKEVNCLAKALQEKEQQVAVCRMEISRRRAIEVENSKELNKIKCWLNTECHRERERADKAEEQLSTSEKKLEDCIKDARTRQYAVEQAHHVELSEMQREQRQEIDELERRQRQSYERIVRAAEETEDRCYQKAAKDAELCAEAAEALSAQIEKNDRMKAEHEKTLKSTSSLYEELLTTANANRQWLIEEAHKLLVNSDKVNEENATLREQLTKAVNEIEELKQKEQNTKADHDQEMGRLEEELQREHEEAFDELVDEHEQDCAELADHLWEADNEIEELHQKEQDMVSEHEKKMEIAKAERVLLENHVHDLVVRVNEVKQEGDELRKQLKEAKDEVQERKEREQELILQQDADRQMFERSLYAMRNLLEGTV